MTYTSPELRAAVESAITATQRQAVSDLVTLAIRVYTDAMTLGTIQQRLNAARLLLNPVLAMLNESRNDDMDEHRQALAELRGIVTGRWSEGGTADDQAD